MFVLKYFVCLAVISPHLPSGNGTLEGGIVVYEFYQFYFFMVLQVHRPLSIHIKLVLTRSGIISFANRVSASKFIELLHAMG